MRVAFRNPRLVLLTVAAAVSLAAIGLTLIDRVQTEQKIRREAVANCVAIEKLKAALTAVLQDARQRVVLRRADLDPVVYHETINHYDRQISRFNQKEC